MNVEETAGRSPEPSRSSGSGGETAGWRGRPNRVSALESSAGGAGSQCGRQGFLHEPVPCRLTGGASLTSNPAARIIERGMRADCGLLCPRRCLTAGVAQAPSRRSSSDGESDGFITRRSAVRSRPPPPGFPYAISSLTVSRPTGRKLLTRDPPVVTTVFPFRRLERGSSERKADGHADVVDNRVPQIRRSRLGYPA